MATRIEIISVVPTGVVFAFTGVDLGEIYEVRNDGRVLIAVRNGSDEPINAIFRAVKMVQELEVEDRIIEVLPGQIKLIGPFMRTVFNTPAGDIRFEFDKDTDVTVAAIVLAR